MSKNVKTLSSSGSLSVKKTITSGVFLALCMILPLFAGHIPAVGQALCPMHIPVLLCGFVCGPVWGAAIGFIAPLLRYVIFHMPPIYPTGVSMCFELLTYGLLSGFLYRALPKRIPYLYLSLIAAMLGGRIVWGLVRTLITLFGGAEFTFALFLTGGFTSAVPGIVCHILILPPIVAALKRAGLVFDVRA